MEFLDEAEGERFDIHKAEANIRDEKLIDHIFINTTLPFYLNHGIGGTKEQIKNSIDLAWSIAVMAVFSRPPRH